MTAPTGTRGRASSDDPRVMLDEQIGVFEPIPPYPPRTEREAEFYTLRDGEMLCENADYHEAICYLDPLEYVSSLFCEWPGVMAFEKLLDVEVPRRAEYIRVLSSELNRVASHALFMGWMALDLGGLTPILWGFIERDEIVDVLTALTGQRMLFNYFRIGGVNAALNHEFMRRLDDSRSRAPDKLVAGTGLLTRDEIFAWRMRGLALSCQND